MEGIFSRAELIIGKDGIDRLSKARAAVAGVGGVGSFAAEALIRGGIGRLLLIDNDVVARSNLNRQLHATTKTIGQYKTHLMARRAREINPGISIETSEAFLLPENCAEILLGDFDFIIDAVDTVAAKLALIMEANRRGIPIISVMGTGNKRDPQRLRVDDIYSTQNCPLCRVMRRELRKRDVPSLRVVCSDEEPAARHNPPGSLSFVPPVAGMLAAGVVINELLASRIR